jgi:hypothetical protein
MNPEILQIIDRALVQSLWIFLICFLTILVYSRYRLLARLRRVADLFDREEKKPKKRERLPVNEWQLAMRTLLVSGFISAVFFIVYIFTPLPVFQNFAAGDAWRITPLRVTAVTYDRYYEGFSMEGEVWNQTEEPLLRIRAVVNIWGTDDKLLGEVIVPIEPPILAGGTAGTFGLSYEENSPFIKGYQLSFIDQENQPVPHSTGFDLE